MPQTERGPKSEEYEKIIRFAKKIANGDNDRDNRFRNMDKLRDFVKKDKGQFFITKVISEELKIFDKFLIKIKTKNKDSPLPYLSGICF
jgi:hypothetical protein